MSSIDGLQQRAEMFRKHADDLDRVRLEYEAKLSDQETKQEETNAMHKSEMTRVNAQHTEEMSAMAIRVAEEQRRTKLLETKMSELEWQITSLKEQKTAIRNEAEQAKNDTNGWERWCDDITANLKQENRRLGLIPHGHQPPIRSITSVRNGPANPSGSSNSTSEVRLSANNGRRKMYVVKKILEVSVNPHGLTLYRVRWKGYGPEKDTWEPLMNIANTGHVDRFIMQQLARNLQIGMPGVAELAFNDEGTRIKVIVDLSHQTFRTPSEPKIRSEWDEENDYSVVKEGARLEVYWEYSGVYVPCKVLSWTPPSKTEERSSPHFDNPIACAYEQEFNLFHSSVTAALAKSQEAVMEVSREKEELLSERASLKIELEKFQENIVDLAQQKKALKKEKDGMQEQKVEWENKFHEAEKMIVDMRKEHADEVANATKKTVGDMKVLRDSYDERVNDMKEKHSTVIRTMANASMHKEEKMKADHLRKQAEARLYYQQHNDQNLAANTNHYEEKLSSLRHQLTEQEALLYQQYNGRLESKDNIIRALQQQLRAPYEIVLSNEQEEAHRVEGEARFIATDKADTTSSGSATASDDDTQCLPPKKRKI